jgi:glycosyltransferase involved in cell wall biosynthesis
MSILFSVPHAPTFQVEPRFFGSEFVEVRLRGSDWGKKGLRKRVWHFWEGLELAYRARKYRALVLCSVSIEAFVVAVLRSLLCPRTRLVFVDFLIPRESRWSRLLGRFLEGVDAFVCIRSGDIQTLGERFLVSSERCWFSPFPGRTAQHWDLKQSEGKAGRIEPEGQFLYSAGFAHRDWETLIDALRRVRVRAILSPGFDFIAPPNLPAHIEILPPVPPEEGRRLLSQARVTVFSLVDTKLPSGPLVLLDAMAAQRPIVASEVNGTRDYLEHRTTAWLVPPGDPEELADAIRLVWNDRELASQMARKAHAVCTRVFTAERFLGTVRDACDGGTARECLRSVSGASQERGRHGGA